MRCFVVLSFAMTLSRNSYQRQRETDSTYAPSQVEELHARADFWHGTGRYQYRYGNVRDKNDGNSEDVTRIDALEQMIHEGVVPQADRFAGKYGTDVDVSVSLTRARMYASVYARIFLNEGDQLDYQYGSSLRWGFLYMWKTLMLNLQDRELWKAWFKEQRDRLGEKGIVNGLRELTAIQAKEAADTRAWVRNATQKPISAWQAFLTRSDISGNYPVMLGIPGNVVEPLPAAHDYLRAYETRTAQPFSIGDCTHLEVPLRRIEETRELLASNGVELPVIPIEDGDLRFSRIPLRELLRPDLD